MTEKEIVQALREDCKTCSENSVCKNGVNLAGLYCANKDAADLIERLTAENVALREGASLGKVKRSQKQAYEKQIKFLQALTNRQLSEIKKLQKDLCWKDLEADAAEWKQERAEAERDALREKVPRWISVDDRHPKPGTRVLATDGVFVGEAIYALDGRWSGYGGGILRDCLGSVITHWMPLPEAPKFADILRGAPEETEEGEKA